MIGDFWIVCDYTGSFEGLKFVGQGSFGYDAKKKKYVGTWIDSFSPNVTHMVGTYDKEVTCRLCKLNGKEETPYHLATECLGAWRTRFDLMGCYSYSQDEPFDWDPKTLLQFFKHYDLENQPNWL